MNQQQKNTFIMCKQLNGPVFKSLKTERSRPKSEKIWSGRARAKILFFVSGRAGAEISVYLLARAGLRLQLCGRTGAYEQHFE